MANDEIKNSEKIDVLKFISKTHRKIHDNRINRELKVVILTVSFYAASIVLKYKKILPQDIFLLSLICIVFIVLAFYAYNYIKQSANANDINQDIAEQSENILTDILKLNGINIAYKKEHPCKDRWFWEVSIITISAVFASIALFI